MRHAQCNAKSHLWRTRKLKLNPGDTLSRANIWTVCTSGGLFIQQQELLRNNGLLMPTI